MSGQQQQLTRWEPAGWPVADDWRDCVTAFFDGPSGVALGRNIADRIDDGAVVYPPQPLRALQLTPCSGVQVLILGQDPYHGAGQANGLAFSVAPGVRVPPSLRNIYAEVDRGRVFRPELSGSPNASARTGDLAGWARQGVLLLNTALTVEDGQPASHSKVGWEVLTDGIIMQLLDCDRPLVCMLWGAHAQRKRGLMAHRAGHAPLLVLQANHPSPLSARRLPMPFLGCGHFEAANNFLRGHGAPGIRW